VSSPGDAPGLGDLMQEHSAAEAATDAEEAPSDVLSRDEVVNVETWALVGGKVD
jgi:hypothetical protein